MDPFSPLRKKGADFGDWDQGFQEKWEGVLHNILNEVLVNHYDPEMEELTLEVDASLYSFGGCVFQDGRIIYLTSGSFGDKSLATNPQRELYFVVSKAFHLLEGHQIMVHTDCRSLLAFNHSTFKDHMMKSSNTKFCSWDWTWKLSTHRRRLICSPIP